MDIQNIVLATQIAIKESGRPFNEIEKEAVMQFLTTRGIKDNKTKEVIYKTLRENFNNEKNEKSKSVPVAQEEIKTETKIRQPRKSVFGPITRIS